ncbi:MAG TPA: hypothetical protein PLA96_03800, partial [Candidatus Brocadia sapporoensis]|nr:hypothetical protein [Candidatus Brocadia sapporoensis]
LTILRKYSLSPSVSLNSYSVFENKNERDYHHTRSQFLFTCWMGFLSGLYKISVAFDSQTMYLET